MADINVKVILGIVFLALNKININFAEQKLIKRFYYIAEALPITK